MKAFLKVSFEYLMPNGNVKIKKGSSNLTTV